MSAACPAPVSSAPTTPAKTIFLYIATSTAFRIPRTTRRPESPLCWSPQSLAAAHSLHRGQEGRQKAEAGFARGFIAIFKLSAYESVSNDEWLCLRKRIAEIFRPTRYLL